MPVAGRLRASVLVSLSLVVLAPSAAYAQTTALFIDSDPDHPVGLGVLRSWTPADLQFTSLVASDRSWVVIDAATPDGSTRWRLYFQRGSGIPLSPGTYENWTGTHRADANQLSVLSQNACSPQIGRFEIHEITIDASGVLTQFAADFEHHCDRVPAALFGAVRYQSTRASLNPFDGDYPNYGLRITPAVNGYVIAPGIDCGAGRTDCEQIYPNPVVVTVQAVPSPGYVFLGWTGYDCWGTDRVSVTVGWMMSCTPVFNAAPGGSGAETPDYSAEVLFLDGFFRQRDSLPPTRRRMVFFPPESEVAVTGTLDAVMAWVSGPEEVSLTFGGSAGELLSPGFYGPTSDSAEERLQEPYLRVFAEGRFCWDGGRFTIHELEFSAGAITRFSADFEVPCGGFSATDPATLLAGSIRFRSTRSTLLPFDGAYPRHRLTIRSTLGGYVTSDGIACGDGGRTDCDQEYSSQILVPLQAHASPGYSFLGWGGRCRGSNPSTTVLMDRTQTCVAVFNPTPASGAPADPSLGAATLVLEWPGGARSPNPEIFLDPVAWLSDVFRGSSAMGFRFQTLTGSRAIRFSPRELLVPGEHLLGDYAALSGPGVTVGLEGDCGILQGSLTVYQAEFDGAGDLVAFAADFQGLCAYHTEFEGLKREYVAGAVRFNSSRTVVRPFNGSYPRYQLGVVPSPHGRVTAPGIDCGPSTADCVQRFAAPGPVALLATPAAGYRFAGWLGACQGGASTTLMLDSTRRCAAVFAALHPGEVPQDTRLSDNALLLHSTPGDPVGLGQRILLFDSITEVRVEGSPTLTLDVDVNGPDLQSWRISVSTGHLIVPGMYWAGPLGSSFTPSINVSGGYSGPLDGLRYCSSARSTGRFIIYEIAFDSASPSTVTALSMDFEQRCTATSPPLIGSVRFNASRAEIRPFMPATPPGPRFDLNGDGAVDLLWQNRDDGRLMFWHMDGARAFFAEPLAPDRFPCFECEATDTAWHVVGAADANRDGFTDLYWQHQTTGALVVWYMRGHVRVNAHPLSPGSVPDTNWKVRTVADMNRDGRPDLIWQHVVTGDLAIWFMNNLQQLSGRLAGRGPVTDVNWTIVGAGDVNRDGWNDLLWHHVGTGQIAVWFMQGTTMLSGELLSPEAVPDTDWRVRGVADLDKNGYPDLLWQHLSTLDVAVWFMRGRQLIDGRLVEGPPLIDPAWHLVAPK